MDSEWRKTPKFMYGKVLEGSGKFRGHTEKVRNILEGVGPGQQGRPHRARCHLAGRPGQGRPRVGEGESLPPSMRVGKVGGLSPPHFLLGCPLSFHIGKLEFELV